jgi:cholest-4-en-3-one 26-monooxygenase
MTLQDIDILNPDLYVLDVPHSSFELLRREAPVFWHKEPDGPGFWAITKHDDVVAVLKDAATFSSQIAGTQIPDVPEGDIRRSPDLLAIMDPPRHTRYRALIGQSFTSRGLSQSEDHIRTLTSELLDRLIERESFDFVTEFAVKLPMAVILRLVGVPDQDHAQLSDWILRVLATDDPEFATTPDERAGIGRRIMEYAHALAAERRTAPRDDLLSVLMAAEIDGQKLSYGEFGMFFLLLLGAGTDTPLVVASTALTLMQHPAEGARLRENPDLLENAMEEILRLHPPFMHFRRTAVRDTQIRGQRIAAGEKVVTWLVSANRDHDAFDQPHTFDIARASNPHVSFGHGPHFCIGNALARRLCKIALAECVRRLPNLELNGEVKRLRSNWYNGPKRMPVIVGRRA